jgi:hypothetical protein
MSDQQRDHKEELHNANLCPGCDHSPCIATPPDAKVEDLKGWRGACEPETEEALVEACRMFFPEHGPYR